MQKPNGRIDSVTVLSESEQVAFIISNAGSFVVGAIPDARYDTIYDVPILKRVESLDEAERFYQKRYGLK